MKKMSLILLLLLAACANDPQAGAALGGAIGSAAGAAVGYNMGGRSGAILGAAIGGATGAVVGHDGSTARQRPARDTRREYRKPPDRGEHRRREHVREDD
ncbi:MAG: hypothetical protein R8K48_03205 [Gallionella sp.]